MIVESVMLSGLLTLRRQASVGLHSSQYEMDQEDPLNLEMAYRHVANISTALARGTPYIDDASLMTRVFTFFRVLARCSIDNCHSLL